MKQPCGVGVTCHHGKAVLRYSSGTLSVLKAWHLKSQQQSVTGHGRTKVYCQLKEAAVMGVQRL